MKRTILALTISLMTSSVAAAQFSPSKENLRGLKGVDLTVMFGHCPSRSLNNCAEGLEEAQRPAVLKMLEADATANFNKPAYDYFASRANSRTLVGRD